MSIEQKLINQVQKLGLFSRNLIDAIWVVDLETMKYTYISPTVTNLRGYTIDEILGARIQDQMTPESFDRIMDELAEGLEEYEINLDVKRTLEVEMYHKKGHTIWMEITAGFAKEQNGRLKITGISKNISHRKKEEADKEKLIKQLETALKEQETALKEKERLLHENKILRGLLPICAECKKIRDEQGLWWPVEEFIASRTEADFTHTICPDCKKKTLEELRSLRSS